MVKAKSKSLIRSSFWLRYPIAKVLAFFLLANLGLGSVMLVGFFITKDKNAVILNEDDLFAKIDHVLATNDHENYTFYPAQNISITNTNKPITNSLTKIDIEQFQSKSELKKVRQILGTGKINLYLRNSKVEMACLLDKKNKIARRIFKYGSGFYDNTGKRHDNVQIMTKPLALIKPVGAKKPRISSGYGMRVHPILKTQKFHAGIDIAANKNSLILCALPGKVKLTAYNRFYGTYVIIQHTNGLETLYAHLNSIDPQIKMGKKIAQGAVVGKMGSTGRATAPHLHFETRINGKHTNPASVKPIYEHIPEKSKKLFDTYVKNLINEAKVTDNFYEKKI